jgi:adenylate kinase
MLSEHHDIPHISTGDILRSAVAAQTDLGQKAQSYMDEGELVPDALILEMIRERLAQTDAKDGWILDGFPRTVPQAQFLDHLLADIHHHLDMVINFEVPDEVIITRLRERGRKDDAAEVIKHRLAVYREQTAQVIDFYRDRQQLISIDGNQPPEHVAEEVETLLHPV